MKYLKRITLLLIFCVFISIGNVKADDGSIKITVSGTGGLTGLGDVSLKYCTTYKNGKCTAYRAVDNYTYTVENNVGTVYCLDGHAPGPLGKKITYTCMISTDSDYNAGFISIANSNGSYFDKQIALRVWAYKNGKTEGLDTYGNAVYGKNFGWLVSATFGGTDSIYKYSGNKCLLTAGAGDCYDKGTWNGKFVDGSSDLSTIDKLITDAESATEREFIITGGSAFIQGNNLVIPVTINGGTDLKLSSIKSFEVTGYTTTKTATGYNILIPSGKSKYCDGKTSASLDINYKLSYSSKGDNIYYCTSEGYQPMLLNKGESVSKTVTGATKLNFQCKASCEWDTNKLKPDNCCDHCKKFPTDSICTKEALKNCEEKTADYCDYFVSTGDTETCSTDGRIIYDDALINSVPKGGWSTTTSSGNTIFPDILTCAIDDEKSEYVMLSNPYCSVYCADELTYSFPGSGMTVTAGYRFGVGNVSFNPRLDPIRLYVKRICRTNVINYSQFVIDYNDYNDDALEYGEEYIIRSKQEAMIDKNPDTGKKCTLRKTGDTCLSGDGYKNQWGEEFDEEDDCLGSGRNITTGEDDTATNPNPACADFESFGKDCSNVMNPDKKEECMNAQIECLQGSASSNSTTYERATCTYICEKYNEGTEISGVLIKAESAKYKYKEETRTTPAIDVCYAGNPSEYKTSVLRTSYYESLYTSAINSRNASIKNIETCNQYEVTTSDIEPEVIFSYENETYYKWSGQLERISGSTSSSEITATCGSASLNGLANVEATGATGTFINTYSCDESSCNKASSVSFPTNKCVQEEASSESTYKLSNSIYQAINKPTGISTNDQTGNNAYKLGAGTLPIHYSTTPGTYPYQLGVNINVSSTHKWYNAISNGISYDCTYNVTKGLWEGPTCMNLIYRTISLSNPFPGFKGGDRKTGDNWCDSGDTTYTYSYEIIKDSEGKEETIQIQNSHAGNCEHNNSVVKTYIHNNRGVEDDEVYSLDPMYTITLTPSSIRDIRVYNRSHEYTTYDEMKCDNGTHCISDYLRNGIGDDVIGTSCGILGKTGSNCGTTIAW